MSTATASGEDLFPWNDEQFRLDPYPWYDRARALGPVHRTDDGGYVLTRYEDILATAKLPSMSIVAPGDHEDHPWDAFGRTVLSLDPPQHTRMRRLTNRWLTPKMVAKCAAVTRELVSAKLASVAREEVIDAHFDLGVEPTHATMCRLLDVAEGDSHAIFWALWDAMLINASSPAEGTHATSVTGLRYLFDETEQRLAEKRANPGTGLADDLLGAYDRGEISWREALETVVLFYMSGGPNPAYLIAAAIKVFAERPDQQKVFLDHPELRMPFVNEVARLHPVELILTRFPTEDIEVAGVRIPAGSTIRFPVGAANRDPEVFANPHTFDLKRSAEPSRNLSFGLGAHSCAGQLLARVETEAVLTAVAESCSEVRAAGETTAVRTDRLVAFDRVPVSLH